MARGPDALGSQHYQTPVYALTLIRYIGPGFDDMALEERADLIEDTRSHIYELVEVVMV
jgi:hypothetical protein